MSLRIRRGTNSQRQAIIFDHGELIYTTDVKQLFIGDGATSGGTNVLATTAGLGLTWNSTTQQLDITGSNLTTNEIVETTNFYFTTQRARDAAASMFTHADGMSNIAFTYDQLSGKINAVVTLDGVGLISVSQDTNPHLGGNLVLSGHNITGTGSIDITGNLIGTTLSGNLGATLGLNSHNITGTGDISITGAISGTTLSGNLGANLGLNSHNITGTGDISITGAITGTTLSGNLGANLGLNTHAITGTGNINISGYVTATDINATAIHAPAAIELRIRGTANQHPGVQVAFEVQATPGVGSILPQEGDFNKIEIRSFVGDYDAPGDVQSGNVLGVLTFTGIIGSTDTDIQSYVGMQVDPIGVTTASHLPTKFFVATHPATPGALKTMTFDCEGRLAINKENAQATLDIDGVMKLSLQTAAPNPAVEGMIAIADRIAWDPASKGSGVSYPVYYDGITWNAFY